VSELQQLKDRVNEANFSGLTTAIIKEDYEPAGQMMINQLVESGEYISRRDNFDVGSPWKVWKKEFAPKF
jgi:hypothetical protein